MKEGHLAESRCHEIRHKKYIMAHAGLEPATFALLARRSNQLS
jgi:hypothetical protein